MKSFAAFFILLFNSSLMANPGVLIAGFDPFDRASSNNSTTLGKMLVDDLKRTRSETEFKFCQLRTVYNDSFETLLDCARSMREVPKFILALGEGGCSLRIETFSSNKDRDYSQDNNGVHRNGVQIIPNSPERLGINLPLHKAWCSLRRRDKKKVNVSTKLGSFVCNNLSYLMNAKAPEFRFGFMHVPAHNCLYKENKNSVRILKEIVLKTFDESIEGFSSHPTMKHQARELITNGDNCQKEFYTKMLKNF